MDHDAGQVLYTKNADAVRPIASITKLMTAMVIIDAGLPLDERIRIDAADVDLLKHSRSRLRQGTTLARRDLLKLALISSENRAAAALARSYPGGTEAFVERMNAVAAELGMKSSRFADATGLSSENVSTAWDLARLVDASCRNQLIREFTTTARCTVDTVEGKGGLREFCNTNPLVSDPHWQIGLSKTGYIGEAGPCLVMEARIAERPYVIVILDAQGKHSRVADARRIRHWLESAPRIIGATTG
jgi:D-alanyl-D-alanine endopeptidase (penicillin-binding protein 7)